MSDIDLLNNPQLIAETTRARRISVLDAYMRGTQYDKRPDWFTGDAGGGEIVPLRERKPCFIYPLPKAAVNQAVRFSVGEGRFPSITVDEIEEVDAIAPGLSVSKADAEQLTKLVDEIVHAAWAKTCIRQMMASGLSRGTAVAIFGVRRGKFFVDAPRPQDCWPVFQDNDPSADVETMVWCFRHAKQVKVKDLILDKEFLFRRDITAEHFIEYEDAEQEVGKPIKWVEKSRTAHGFGLCPVVWVRNMPESHCSDIDGVSIYGEMLDEFDGLNFSLSQQSRGIHYFGTPQAYETSVGDDERPAAVGRTAKAVNKNEPIDPFGVTPKKARKAAPDSIWSYKGAATLGILETSGKAFEVSEKHVRNIRARVLESINVVLMDPETALKQDLSGVALTRVFSPMLAMIDELREHWWEQCIARMISMMLRIIAVTGGKGLLIPGATRMATLLLRFNLKHEGGMVWCPPKMTPTWGNYFSPGPDDILKNVEAAERAKTAKLITGKTATRYVSTDFGVEDPVAEAEEADDNSLEESEKALKTAIDEQGAEALKDAESASTAQPDAGVGPPEKAAADA
jgi:hypothetical protein